MGQSAISAACLAALLALPVLSWRNVAEAQTAANKQSFDNRVFSSVLQPGNVGNDVRTLQIALDRSGYVPGPFDGRYGSQTESAVRDFQQRNGLFVTGVADSRTLDALGLVVSEPAPLPVSAPPPISSTSTASLTPPGTQSSTLRRGSQGDRVRDLQRALNRNGANLAVDGVYGANTEQAVIRYQQQRGLRADGVAGAQTLQALGLGSGVSDNRYLAAVPGTSNLRLARQLFGSRVYVQETGRGDLVVIGAYSNRADAQVVVDQALQNGLPNARVIYQ